MGASIVLYTQKLYRHITYFYICTIITSMNLRMDVVWLHMSFYISLGYVHAALYIANALECNKILCILACETCMHSRSDLGESQLLRTLVHI